MNRHTHSAKRSDVLRASSLTRYPWLVHAFTTRQSGNLSYNVGGASRDAEVRRNRRSLLKTQRARAAGLRGGTERFRLVTLRQVHSDIVRVVDASSLGRGRKPFRASLQGEPDGAVKLAGDALITSQPGFLLAVQVADCLPILLVDPVRRVAANVHAGWRGTLARIAEKTVGQMRLRFGCEPRRLLAVIGPGIHACCYEVGPEVFEGYSGRFPRAEALFRRIQPSPTESHRHPKVIGRPLKPWPTTQRRDASIPSGPTEQGTRYFLDLVEANRQQLLSAGLRARNITALPFCTACRTDRFFSHRAEAGRTGRQMGVVGIVSRAK